MPHLNPSRPYIWRRWVFIGAVMVQLIMAAISILLMSCVRTLVSGESLWSKGAASAGMHLHYYAESGAPEDYQAFTRALQVPLSVAQARERLDAGDYHPETLRTSLLRGENHPNDVATIVHVLPAIWQLPAIQPALALWRLGDAQVAALQQLGEQIAQRYAASAPITPQEIAQWRQRNTDIQNTVMPLAKQFSATLGDNSRQLSRSLLLLNLCTALIVGALYWLSMHRAMKASTAAASRLETERLRSGVTLAALNDGVLTLDAGQRIRYANPAASQLLDLPLGRLLGRPVSDILPFASAVLQRAPPTIGGVAVPTPPDETVHWITRDGSANAEAPMHPHAPATAAVAVRLSVTHLENEDQPTGSVLVLRDVSQEQNYMRMLLWQQNHDMLTGLDNRPAFEKYLQQVLGKHHASLLHLNLDHFKMINASYGHAAGDEILRQVCQEMRLALRESDVIARVGGDEFAVLLNHCMPHAAMQTAERLRKSVHELNVYWRQHNLHTGVSIGVVHIDPQYGNDSQSLLGMADSACKHAKESGRNRITVYDPFNRIFQRYQSDMEWVQRLRSSLEHNRFALYAQTVYPLSSTGKKNSGLHFEVLLRLSDRPGKPLSPTEFIPIAERYDLMTQIDRWVVQQTLKLLRQHLAQGANIATCAINLSGTSLGNSDLLDFIRHNILEQGVSADKLCFEITETSAIASMESAIAMMRELRQLGCRFSLDDFGSGMASFKYLQQLPVDYLKIDGSFVRDMLKNPSNHAMVDAINHIGHVMGKATVAEFVGDAPTLEALQSMGVDYAQGYYIAPPVPLDAGFFTQAGAPAPQMRPGMHQSHSDQPPQP